MNKSSTSNSQESTHLGSKTESAAPSLGVGVVSRPANLASSGPVSNMSIFTTAANSPASGTSAAGVTTAANFEAVRRSQELAARMGFRYDPQFAPLINMFPGQVVESSLDLGDVALLHSGNYGDIANRTIDEDNLKMKKITFYVEHPRPIEPPAELAPPPPQPLKLTKQEQKKLKTQRRIAKEKERQEMIRQGVIEPRKPKLKMNNLMKVLGTEATQDPTRLEKEVRIAAAEREQAHIDRNIARKLTPAEQREKKKRKLFDDSNTPDRLVA
ncbi:U4/U6 small nuclear ribonucleoprotein Prp3, partial [Trifolium pratense]